jgi:tRNA(Ile2) C34 agmatinyltransferase TiaS
MNGLLRRRGPICPNCGTAIRGKSVWWGFARRFPGRCQGCGVRVAYDLVGGVYVVPEQDEDSRERKDGTSCTTRP